ncbi:MAG: YigZ family protein [Clostridia bacterium]|nr:YigZ family protein [Clostridia bacterium]
MMRLRGIYPTGTVIKISQKECYKTVSRRAEAVLVEKRSKFIATVIPADTEEKALCFLEEMRKAYSDATHNVYAYVIDENNIFRYSDDNEPSGTAGMPVLDTIRKAGIVDCAVVVTRYFGGTLLGTGGLVHAYGGAAREGLLAAGVIERRLCNIITVTVDYTTSGRVSHFLAESGHIIENTVYDSEVTYFVCVTKKDTESFKAEITELTNGRAVMAENGTKYIDIDLNERMD